MSHDERIRFVEVEGQDPGPFRPAIAVDLGRIKLISHTVATGGVILVTGQSPHRLTPIQLALLRVLAQQTAEDQGKHHAVRGFVSSCELLCRLPFDTPHPELNHLKQLIRRVRRRVSPLGLDVQSSCGLGYRLVV